MSACTTSRACACATAAQTGRNSPSVARSDSACADACCVMGWPSSSSITKYDWPSGVMPPSSSRAIFGCCRSERICRSRANCAASASEAKPRRISLTATLWSNTPSSRSARNARPMPPRPSSSPRRYGPTRSGGGGSASSATAAGSAVGSTRSASLASASRSRIRASIAGSVP
jgi:hypothetical protein